MNIQQAKTSLKYIFAAGYTPHFIGKHGVGKSASIYQFAAENGYEVCEIRVGQMADAGDLIGLQEFIKSASTGEAFSTKHILPDWFMKATKPGAKVIIFIDELNRGHKDLLQAIFELVYDRKLKGISISENCYVVAASNPATDDYAVLDFNDAAFQDRFVHIKFEPSNEEFVQYIRDNKLSFNVADFIQEYPAMLEDQKLQSFNLDFVKPSRRSWERIARLEALNIPSELELEIFMGVVGLTPANSYRDFRAVNFKSLKADIVLNDYSKAKKEVLATIKKGRTDMLGTLNEELSALIKTLDGLTAVQADNLADLVHDLPAEHAWTLGMVIKENSPITTKIKDMNMKKMMKVANVENLGMFAHKKFVDRISIVHELRNEAAGTTPEQANT
jgi:hypothetical protein